MNNYSILICNILRVELLKPKFAPCYTEPLSNTFNYIKNKIDHKVAIDFHNFEIQISISTDKPVSFNDLRDEFLCLHELFMLLLGYFPDIKEINIFGENESNNDYLKEKSQKLHEDLLSCYYSYNDIKKNCTCLIDIATFDYKHTILKWISYRHKYNLQHRLYLYTTSAIEFLIDLRLALLSQVFEPMFQVFCQRKKPKIFKNILQEIILIKGTHIFEKEINNKKLVPIIDKIKSNRNQLFHVNKMKNIPTGAECLCLFHKLNLLYRHSLLYHLEINFEDYSFNFKNLIKLIEASFKECS
ncbi:Uncharacterised protein [Legionella beliardensis]|uniref:ApeA N-terminal domain-containing protein n=1 Tax=Legionella beliardensis TaxID=91822 RepID=A0A378JYG2_9GAMM|nr:hypothetical protein [Legionella beliardensis]STX55792.1 Uncharacterised protein [Legionella beliardensis]